MLTVKKNPKIKEDKATISFKHERNVVVTIDVYNDIGSLIATLHNEEVEANKQYKVEFDTGMLPEGTYYAILQDGVRREIVEMKVIRSKEA